MADKEYIVRLRVDATGAKTELADFIAKADGTTAPMKRIAKSYEDLQAKTDPVFKALLTQQREVEKATKAAADAVKYYGVSQEQANATIKRTTDYYGQLATKAREGAAAQSMLGKAFTGVQGQLVALSAGAGPVGTFLAGLGPWGIAGAAGIGLISAAFTEARRTADALAKEAGILKNSSETTGFSTDMLQAVTAEAAKHGVSMEQAAGAIDKFTTAWAEAREGGGAMLNELQRIDPALANQIQLTKDSAVAFDLLTVAIKKAEAEGDIARRNQLLRAAGGRGGITAFAGLSTAITNAGGLDELTRSAKESGKVIGNDLLREVDRLKDELDDTRKRADLLMGAIGAKPILEADLAWEKMRVRIAQTTNELKEAEKNKPFWEWLFEKMGGGDHVSTTLNTVAKRSSGLDQPALNQLPAYPPVTSGLEGPPPEKNIKAQLADLKEYTTLLGSGATEADKLKLKLLELKAAVDGNATAENRHAAEIGRTAAITDAYIATINLRNAAMGTAATTQDIVTAKMAALSKLQQQGAGLTDTEIANQKRVATEQANGTAAILSQVDAQRISAQTQGLGVGAAAALSAKLQLLAQDARAGKVATEEDNAAREKAVQELGAQAAATAQLDAQRQANFALATAGLSAIEQQIAAVQKQLHGDDWQQFMNDGLSATMRLTDEMGKLKQATDSFGSSLLSGLLSGQAPLKALTSAAQQYISTLANDTLKRVQGGGDFFGKQSLGSFGGIAAMGSAGLAGYQSGSPLGGALGGAMAGASFGPVGAIVGGAIGLAGGLFGADAKKKAEEEAHKQEVQAAKDAWPRMEGQWKTFLGEMTGHNLGSVQQSILSANAQQDDFVRAAAKAYDLHAGDAQPQDITDTINAVQEHNRRIIAEFRKDWAERLAQMNEGIGPNSPFASALAEIKAEAADVQGFVSDTLYIIGDSTEAPKAAQKYLLSLLQSAPVLSETEQAMQALRGRASGLQQALIDLGMSSDEAANAINSGVTSAISALAENFTDGLQRSLNETGNKGYINEIADTIKKHQQNVSDAALLGISPELADELYKAQIQKIVDGADLVGSAFSDLIQQFPELASVVTKASSSIQALIDSLKIGSNSTLSPAEQLAAAQDIYNRDLAKAQGGDTTAIAALSADTNALLTLAKSFYASSTQYAAIFDTVVAQLNAIGPNNGHGLYMANGGRVSGGIPGVDSVPIMAQQDEFIVNAPAARQNMAILEAINGGATARSFASGGSVQAKTFSSMPSAPSVVAANDNSAVIQTIQSQTRTIVMAMQAQIESNKDEIGGLRAEIKRLTDTTRIEASRAKRPGTAAA